MWVRFFDKAAGKYRKSEVYAIINTGIYERLLLRVRDQSGDYWKLFDSVIEDNTRYLPAVNRIFSSIPEGWVFQETSSVDELLPGYRGLEKYGIRFYQFYGFAWLWEESAVLQRLLAGQAVRVEESGFMDRLYSDLSEPGWNYVEYPQDADYFLKETGGLHDSTIHTIRYESGNYVDEKNTMCFGELRHVVMELHSQWCPRLEMVFDGVIALNLRPPGDYYMGDIFDCTLLVEDCQVYFADCALDGADTSYDGTWITAYSLKWRFLNGDSID